MKSLVKRVLSGISTAILVMCLLSGCALFVRDCGETTATAQGLSTVPDNNVESSASMETKSSDP